MSLGGIDDEIIAVWDIRSGQPIGSAKVCPDRGGYTTVLGTFNIDDNSFVTAGETTLRIWEMDTSKKGCKLKPSDISLTGFKRNFTCVTVSSDDKYLYAGTSTGDIVMTTTCTKLLKTVGPEKNKLSGGIAVLLCLGNLLLAGAGDGTINFINVNPNDTRPVMKKTKTLPKFEGSVTSVTEGKGEAVYVGTSKCYLYMCQGDKAQLYKSSHSASVNCVAFPSKTSGVFCTASDDEIRIWQNAPGKPIVEARRIVLPHITCNVLAIAEDGTTIISGWSDGIVRAFYPESGKHMYTIDGAHQKGVTALTSFNEEESSTGGMYGKGHKIITGGGDGKVRIWWVESRMTLKGDAKVAQLLFSLDQHKDAIMSLSMRNDNKYVISGSKDGSYIVWELSRGRNAGTTFPIPNTACTCIAYDREESYYIISSGNGKLAFRSIGGTPIGEYDATAAGEAINNFDRSKCGRKLVTSSEGGSVKLWELRECDSGMGDGSITLDVKNIGMGVGHGGPVRSAKFSPCGGYIVSAGADGSIVRWKVI